MSLLDGACEIALEGLLPQAEDGLFVIDRNRRFALFSEGCERITGFSSAAVLGSPAYWASSTKGREGQGRTLATALCPNLQLFRGERSIVRRRMCLRHREGHHVWVDATYSAIYDAAGQVVGIVGLVRDISEHMVPTGDGATPQQWSKDMDVDSLVVPAGAGTSELVGGDGAPGVGALDRILFTIEKREIVSALNRANGQRTLAAKMLGISRSRLYRRMEALGVDPKHARGDGMIAD